MDDVSPLLEEVFGVDEVLADGGSLPTEIRSGRVNLIGPSSRGEQQKDSKNNLGLSDQSD